MFEASAYYVLCCCHHQNGYLKSSTVLSVGQKEPIGHMDPIGSHFSL